MAPLMSLTQASCRSGQSMLGGSRNRSSSRQPRGVSAHAASEDTKCNAAIASLSAAALLASPGMVHPAAAADLAPAHAAPTVLAGSQLTTAANKMAPGVSAPQVLAGDDMTRTSSGPQVNMDDPDAYFDSLDRLDGRVAPRVSYQAIKYVEANTPMPVMGELADLNADVRGAATDYRDPAIATPQDKLSGAVSGSSSGISTPDLPSSSDLSDAADAAKSKAKSLFGSGSSSALPAKPIGELADLNADVRDLSKNYRDPAGAIQQDKFTDAVSGSSLSSPDLSSAGDKLSDAADAAKSKAKSIFGSGSSSALPTNPLAAVADLNADVRDLSKNYRDPAGAIQQDKFTDAVSGSSLSSPDLSSAGDKLSDAADAAKAKASKMFSALPTNPLAAVADLNADVRDAASGYRDPAIATPQDKLSGAVSGSYSGISTPDLPSSSDLSDAADAAKSKAKSLFGSGSSSALPTNPLAAVADLNADVRDLSKNYRDPAGAIQQDKAAGAVKDATRGSGPSLGSKASEVKSKAKKMLSAAPVDPVGELADLNADVRDAATDYRDPAIATPQDKLSGAVSGSSSGISTPDLPSSSDLSDAADAAKSKAKSLFGSGSSSALPAKPMGELADLNADVRDLSKNYRDPAGAIQQDKAADAVSGSSLSSPDLSSAGDKLSDAADAAKSKAKSLFGSGSSSALPAKPMGELADLNADVRDLSKNYRDPAGAIQQDKFTDAVSGSSSPDLSSAGDKLSDAADAAKSKAKSLFGSGSSSALPTNPLAAVADLNADVRDLSKNYRDPAGAIQQDKAASAVKDATRGSGPSLGSKASEVKSKAKRMLSAAPVDPVGELADLNADVRDAATDYRDPAIATPQDKLSGAASGSGSSYTPSLDLPSSSDLSDAADAAKSKAKSLFGSGSSSALPAKPMAELADLNADVRNLSKNYRDPVGAIKQDTAAAAKDAASSRDSLSGKASAATGSIKKSVEDLTGTGLSALPVTPFGDLADLNADVRDIAKDYRDPAGAIQQDKAASAVKDATQSSKASDVTTAAKSKAKSLFGSGSSSALPTKPIGELADLNADVRDLSKNYRDPAGAIQQDKFTDAVSGSSLSSPDLSSAGDKLSDAADAAKTKASKMFSALPANPLAAVADLNADVRDDASGYRDPAGAIQQDKAAGAVKDATKGKGDITKLATDSAKKITQKVKPQINIKASEKRDIGVGAGYSNVLKDTVVNDSAGIKHAADDLTGSKPKPVGNARLSKPLVRDSLGVKRSGSKNQTGAAGGSDRGALDLAKDAASRI